MTSLASPTASLRGKADRGLRRYAPQARAILQVVLDSYREDDEDPPPVIIPVVPKSLTIHRNGYNQADSWELTFDANDLPIDPRMVRSGAAELFLFHAEPSDERRVFSRQVTELETPDPSRLFAGGRLPEGLSTDRFTLGNNPLIVGIFDEHSLELSEDGKWVSIQGQDYTAFLLDKQWPPLDGGRARRIPTGQRLDDFVTGVLELAEPDGRLVVAVRGVEDDELPTVGQGEVRGNRRGIPVEAGTTCWDVIYKVVTRYGFIAFVDGLQVVIARPQNLDGRDLSRVRRFAWGDNLESLNLSRKLGKEKSPTIVLRCYDPVQRKTISAEWPPNGLKRATSKKSPNKTVDKHKADPGGAKRPSRHKKAIPTVRSSEEYEISTWNGPPDHGLMLAAAKARHHEIGKEERTLVATTRDLDDALGKPCLDVRAGDAVEIEWDDFNREMLQNPSLPIAEKARRLVDRGLGQAIAEEIAEHYEQMRNVARAMYMREGTVEYDVDDGVSIEMELVDFVVVEDERSADDKDRPDDRGKRRPPGKAARRLSTPQRAWNWVMGGGK